LRVLSDESSQPNCRCGGIARGRVHGTRIPSHHGEGPASSSVSARASHLSVSSHPVVAAMQCVHCGGELVSVLERSRKLCAPCFLLPPPRAKQQPSRGSDGSPLEGEKGISDVPGVSHPEKTHPRRQVPELGEETPRTGNDVKGSSTDKPGGMSEIGSRRLFVGTIIPHTVSIGRWVL
jgi:hypothetical protein